MTDVPKIGEVEQPVNEELVAMLERLLAQAKAGEIVAMVATLELTGRQLGTSISGVKEPFLMLGGIEFAKMRIVSQIEGALG